MVDGTLEGAFRSVLVGEGRPVSAAGGTVAPCQPQNLWVCSYCCWGKGFSVYS